ncbi:endonuclease [Arthrobacter phage Phives]|uniref:G-I-Y Y-I-G endonuclease n=1 Tax=Arthrobacter phage Phives TaxID=2776856 RepID=A0A7M1CLI9_9CAUD|nr:endonuclease [Arthrobacter phage Phives]QOP65176.1 G-I-Y Y-I-G endonuclease [Arthrobacter phage Phives]
MPGYVYEIYSWDGDLLYVGKTMNPLQRLGMHSVTQPWAAEIGSVKYTPYESEADALDAEAWAIAALRPLCNTARPVPPGESAPAPIGPSVVWAMPGPRPGIVTDPATITGKVYEVRRRAREEARPNPFEGFVPDVYRITNTSARVGGREVYAAYEAWAKTVECATMTRRSLFRYLGELGAKKIKTNTGVAFVGLERVAALARPSQATYSGGADLDSILDEIL